MNAQVILNYIDKTQAKIANVKPDCPISTIKKYIQTSNKMESPDTIKIIQNGKILSDTDTIDQLIRTKNSTILLFVSGVPSKTRNHFSKTDSENAPKTNKKDKTKRRRERNHRHKRIRKRKFQYFPIKLFIFLVLFIVLTNAVVLVLFLDYSDLGMPYYPSLSAQIKDIPLTGYIIVRTTFGIFKMYLICLVIQILRKIHFNFVLFFQTLLPWFNTEEFLTEHGVTI
ncbi:hypothetical protein TRFO_32112 [Tritrichomonas foetus]|uniref:Ubiquitin-like domain-containing protein n=1 Tax=Tritrichomonas foetus TaxID=1144522 RepID=A0A1J4JV84_9EUKA|nr:hypothetical protein TRFO_32112 [Tritrichomonas foetus]|eukprot:OHT01173.1 hypothetical protein TRFO_32112 [Tritrichomonas foetus]